MHFEIFKNALRLEYAREWARATREWRRIGHEKDAKACELIIEATKKGNEYRARIRAELKSRGLPENLPPCKELTEIMHEANIAVYGSRKHYQTEGRAVSVTSGSSGECE